jgi:hypothetical protein
MSILASMGCCGVREVQGLRSDPKQTILLIAKALFESEHNCAFIILNDANSNKRGQQAADLIRELKLGEISETRSKRNPNSRRLIKVWVWDYDRPALKKYWLEHKSESESSY